MAMSRKGVSELYRSFPAFLFPLGSNREGRSHLSGGSGPDRSRSRWGMSTRSHTRNEHTSAAWRGVSGGPILFLLAQAWYLRTVPRAHPRSNIAKIARLTAATINAT